MARKKHGSGYVYLIHAEGTPHYKIGHAVDVPRRLWQINNCNPQRCVLVHAIPVDCQTEGEYFWHNLFDSTRIKGEWFALTEKQTGIFCACKGGSMYAMEREVYKDNQPLFLAVMEESK